MARKSVLSAEDVHAAVLHAGPAGISPESLAALFAGVSRSSLNRRLLDLVMARRIDARGKGKALTQIVESAKTLPPVQAAFYLMTRIPYLQAFSNGNKRTARLAANIPLLQAGLLPISFVDFRKDEYLLGMLAFYELGDVQIIGDVFIGGYIKSVVRGSDIAPAQKVAGFDMREMVEMLAGYVRTQRKPEGLAAKFLD